MSNFDKQLEEELEKLKKKKKQTVTPSQGDLASGRYSYLPSYKTQVAPILQNSIKKATEESLAPVKKTVGTLSEDGERTWFQKGAFEDGYQFGDITKTILGSSQDLFDNALAGVLDIGEKAVDALATIAPYIAQGMYYSNGGGYNIEADRIMETGFKQAKKETAEFVEKDLYDSKKVAEKLTSNSTIRLLGADTEKGSVFGEKSDSLVQSAGQLGAQIGTNLLLPGSGMALMGVTAFGGESENALKNGATLEEAVFSGAISAGAEILTEKIGGISFGGKTLTDAAFNQLSRQMTGKLSKVLLTTGKVTADALSEGGEEILSGYMSAIGQKLSYMEDKEIEELFSNEDLLESFIGGVVLGGMGGVGGVVQSNSKGVDYVTELTKNEQKVVQQVYKDELAKREEKGKLSAREKSKLYDQVVERMEKGYISTDTIESALGDRSAYDSLQKESDEFKTLYETESGKLSKKQQDRLAELEAKNKATPYESALKDAKDKYSKSVFDLVRGENKGQGSRLMESYNERARMAEDFQADLTKYEGAKHKDAARKTIESAIKAGANNTNRVHDLVDFAAKTSADTGLTFTFKSGEQITNDFIERQTQKIAEMEAIENPTAEQSKKLESLKDTLEKVKSGKMKVNGDITGDGIVLNLDSEKPLNRVVGHEITHSFEPAKGKKSKEYTELQDSLFAYAKSKGIDIDKEIELRKLKYEGITNADPKAELVADLVGDFLFTDSEYINKLSGENRNLFQKLWDEVKYLYKVATAGSQEARELERVKKAFEDAYRKRSQVVSDNKADTNYSLVTDEDTIDFLENQEKVKVYRAMQVIDGELYPPMAARVKDDSGKKQLVEPTKKNAWYQADERPELMKFEVKQEGKKNRFLTAAEMKQNASVLYGTPSADDVIKLKDGSTVKFSELGLKFELDKANGSTVPAAYNPYFHTSLAALNDQFSSAYNRPNLVVVEGYIPKSELTSGYKALYAKDSVGETTWHSGPVASSLKGEKARRVFLSRWFKVGRIVSDAEAAREIAKTLEGEDLSVPWNVVTPSLREALEVNGVNIDYRDAKLGSTTVTFESTKYSLSDSEGKQLSKEQAEYFKDSKVRDENGNLKVMYHGTSRGGFTVFDTYGGNHGLFGIGSYFTDSKNIGESYTKKGKGTSPQVYEAYLNIKNPMDMDAQADPSEWAKAFDEVDFPKSGTNEDFYRAVEEFYMDQWMTKWDVAEAIQGTIESYMGYDGITHIGGGRVNPNGERHRVYIAFLPEQIKNTDNLKPTDDADIRYSLSEDSDGNKLTEEQEKYFSKSKMRDENGNLKVMYHGSKDGGFHVFDSGYSDDGTSFFFVDSNEVASSYSGTSETYAARNFRTADDFNKFFAEIGAEEYEVSQDNGKFQLLDDGDIVAESDTADGIYEEFRDWSGLGYGDVNYKVYLNLKNPLEVDAEGRNWDNVSREFSQEIYDAYQSLTETEKEHLRQLASWEDVSVFRDEILDAVESDATEEYALSYVSAYNKLGGKDADLGNLFTVASEGFTDESIQENAVKRLKTRDYAQKAKAEGYDGVIFKNLVDIGGYGGDYTPSTVAIAFDSNQIKSVANTSPTEDADIRYSLSSVGLDYDGESQTVSYSMTSLEDSFGYNKSEADYMASRLEYETALAKSIAVDKDNVTEEEKAKAKRYLDSLFLIHDMIASDKERLDYEAAVNKSSWVSNAEYGGSIDFSTLCAKRRLFTGTFDAIQNALPNTVLNENDFLRIRNMLLAKDLESPCSMCYVEGSRAKHGVYVERFLKDYLATNPEWKPQIADFTSTTRLEQTRINHPEAYKAYIKAMNALSQRKPKEASVRTDYKGEILRDFKDTSTVAEKNKNGGVRFNSFSDFEIIHALDCMQVLTDMSRVGLNGQAYTKVKEFAEAFGNTGLKINLSLVAKGVDENGKLIMDETNGMKYAEAMDIRNRYSENVGTVIVVFNDAQLKAALADNTIDYVLPFHRSQWKKSQYTLMGLPTETRDYTNIQNDRYKNSKSGRAKKVPTGNIMPNEYWDFNLSGRENAQKYLDYINGNSYIPKFDFLLNKVDGKWVLPEGAVGDGYFKLLIDFKMYDNDGWGSPQKPVVPEFNMPYIQEMLKNYKGGHQAFPVAHDVVSEFVKGKKNGDFSISEYGEQFTPSPNDIYGKDFRVRKPAQDIAPVAETTETVAPVAVSKKETTTDELFRDVPTMAEDEADAQARLASLNESDMPPEVDAPYTESNTAPSDPFENRDFKGVGKRNVHAYMYDNPEVKPFFQAEATSMLGDLERTVKGERIYSEEGGWTGTSRHTTDDIAYLLDMGYTYAQIERGLNDIIEDHGAENNAMAKRIEFALNERLMNGYTDIGGVDIPANQEYLNLLAQKEAAEAVEGQIAPYTDADAPQDIAPVAPAKVEREYEAIRPQPKKQPKMVKTDDIAPVYGEKLVRLDSNNGRPGEKQRKWVGTSTGSEVVDGKVLPDDLNQDLIHYQPISNKTTLGNANARLNRMGYESSISYLNSQFSNNKVTLDDIALGERLIQEAVKKGDTKTAGEMIMDISILGTELGQKVQALSIIKRLTPEGQLKMLQRTVERGKAKGDKAYEGVVITQEMIDKILSVYGKDGTYDQAKLNEVVEDVKKKVADQMKVTKIDKVNAWRYLSMLGNPKTHIRNLVSNVAMKGTVAVKNALARTIETVAPIDNRTKTWKKSTDEVKNFSRKTAVEMMDEVSNGGKYSEDASIKGKRQIFKNKILNGLYEFNSNMLSKEDWWFSRPAFVNSMSEFLTANGIRTEQDIQNNPKLVQKAKMYATEQAQIATFQQYSWLANKINEIERKNTITDIAVGSIMPFKKTPINIAKTGLNYSPLGFAKTLTYDIAKVKKGDMQASELVDHLSQNVTGSALTLVGYMLASSGFLSGGGEDDKEGKYDYQLGEQAYAINIDGKSYSLSWLSPVAMPLFVGANAYEQLVEGKEWNGDVVVETLAQTLDPLSEMSFLSGLDTVLSSYDSGIQKFAGIGEAMAQNYITQFAPTLVSQIAQVTDDTKRSTKVSADSDFKFFDQTINKLKYKIPGLRQTLEPSTDIWGNDVKQTENVLVRAFETFLAPYATREDIATYVDEEIKTLYRDTGDGGVIPSIPNNYSNYKGEKYEMSAAEFTAYKKAYGQLSFDLMERLFATNTYRNATSEEKADLVGKVYDYARDEAKKAFLANRDVVYTNAESEGIEYYKENAIKGAIERDMTPEEYTFSTEYPEKYSFLKDNNVSYSQYKNFDEDTKDAYTWAFNNPEKHTLSKAIASDLVTYRKYAKDLYDIKADKDSSGKSISGSRKAKVVDYINNMDADYGEKIILFKSEYPADDTYNYEIIEYLDSRADISYEEEVTILRELGFTVLSDGTVQW